MEKSIGRVDMKYFIRVFYALAFAIMIFSFVRGVFADESLAVRALENSGYSHVRITSHKWFLVSLRGCGADAAKFDAVARNSAGQEVRPFVCVGWPFKGATVRF